MDNVENVIRQEHMPDDDVWHIRASIYILAVKGLASIRLKRKQNLNLQLLIKTFH